MFYWHECCIDSVQWFLGSAGSAVDPDFVFRRNFFQKFIFMKFYLKQL